MRMMDGVKSCCFSWRCLFVHRLHRRCIVRSGNTCGSVLLPIFCRLILRLSYRFSDPFVYMINVLPFPLPLFFFFAVGFSFLVFMHVVAIVVDRIYSSSPNERLSFSGRLLCSAASASAAAVSSVFLASMAAFLLRAIALLASIF